MRLAILGASGPLGLVLVQQTLDKGHQVKAIVRNPDKITIKHAGLEVVKADIFNPDELTNQLTACDAVVSCLGPPVSIFSEVNLYSEPIIALCTAMRNNSLKRLVCVSRWFVTENSDLHPWYMKLGKYVIRKMIQDARRMENYLGDTKEIDFTVVRPPCLIDEKKNDLKILAEPGTDYSPSMSTDLPRQDLAQLMLRIIEEKLFFRQFVAVGLPKQ